MEYVVAVDQGTTSTRVILFDSNARPVCSHSLEHETYRPKPGWEEHDPKEILSNVKTCIDHCVETAITEHSINPSQIKAVGITNQRETTVVWDKVTGNPLYNAIVWQDNRTQSTCDILKAKIPSETVREITGLPISTYFSGVKFKWLMDNVKGVFEGMIGDTILFGTIDTWLVWNLTREQNHVTDVTNAGRTMLMNLKTLQWDSRMINVLNIKPTILPTIISSSEVIGHLSCTKLDGLPISAIIGDQQSALVGQCCFDKGEAKSTYGTGCFLIINIGSTPKQSKFGLLTTPAYKLGPASPCVYSLEGSIAVAGSAVTWMHKSLGLIDNVEQSQSLAASVEDTGGVYCVPAFTGLYAPWWRDDARGTIVGMTQYTTKAHVVRAVLESVTFQVNDVLHSASKDIGHSIQQLKVDGGVTNNSLVMQMQADIINADVTRPKIIETTSLGAAFCAGHAIGLFQSLEQFKQSWQLDATFSPSISEDERQHKLTMWNKAVHVSLGWADNCAGEGSMNRSSMVSNVIAKVHSRNFWFGIATGIGIACIALQVTSKTLNK